MVVSSDGWIESNARNLGKNIPKQPWHQLFICSNRRAYININRFIWVGICLNPTLTLLIRKGIFKRALWIIHFYSGPTCFAYSMTETDEGAYVMIKLFFICYRMAQACVTVERMVAAHSCPNEGPPVNTISQSKYHVFIDAKRGWFCNTKPLVRASM